MPSLRDILHNFFLPALIVGAAFALAWRRSRRREQDGRWIGAITVSLAFAVADCGIGGTPRWPPGTGDSSYWLVWFAIPLAILGLLDALLHPPLWLRAGLLFVLVRIGAAVLLAPLTISQGSDTLWTMQIWLDVMAAIAVAWWLAWETLAERSAGPLVPGLLVLILAGAAAVLGLGNEIKPSMVAAALTGMAVAATLAAFIWPTMRLDRGAILPWIIPLLGTLAVVQFYYITQPPAVSIILLLLSPLLAFGAELPAIQRLKKPARWAVRWIPVILAVAAAVGFSARQFMQISAQEAAGASQDDKY